MNTRPAPRTAGTDGSAPDGGTRWLLASLAVDAAAAAAGFALGFAFARDAGAGAGMGAVAGLNAALFCTLVADAVMTRLARRRRP